MNGKIVYKCLYWDWEYIFTWKPLTEEYHIIQLPFLYNDNAQYILDLHKQGNHSTTPWSLIFKNRFLATNEQLSIFRYL